MLTIWSVSVVEGWLHNDVSVLVVDHDGGCGGASLLCVEEFCG